MLTRHATESVIDILATHDVGVWVYGENPSRADPSDLRERSDESAFVEHPGLPMVVVVIGVSGSGKTTIGTMLAAALKCPFLEGDSLHPRENIDKMSHGIPLTDSDRGPWLAAIHARILDSFQRGQDLVVGCSALKQAYRRVLAQGVSITWVYLKGSPALIRSRLKHRPNHFMKVDLLASQFDVLEEPDDALVVDVSAPPSVIVEQILSQLRRAGDARAAKTPREDVRVCADLNELSLQVGEAAARTISECVRRAGRCSVALSGGNTPRPLYALLASEFRDQIPWAHVHVFWGDERYVAADDPASNYRMAKEMLLDHVPCPPANVHPMPTHFASADAAARDYEKTLRQYFSSDWPHFDLILLGLGEDGHTASLFPGSPAFGEETRWVVAVETPAEPSLRLTLTLPAITRAANTYVLATGPKKASALRHVLTGVADSTTYPAAGLRLAEGTLTWWVDRGAAGQYTSLPRVRPGGVG